MKRTVAEVLVPAVLRLYGRMRSRGGQLAAYLVRIATDLLSDYRQEVGTLPRIIIYRSSTDTHFNIYDWYYIVVMFFF